MTVYTPNKLEGELFWTRALQEVEDAAHAAWVQTGVKSVIKFPQIEVILDKSIVKKSGVDWVGPASIKRNPSDVTKLWTVVIADEETDFMIENISFSGLPHHLGYPLTRSWHKTERNCILHLFKCERFKIQNCTMQDYSEGIVRTGCQDYSIVGNYLCSKVQGKSIDQFYNDTYEPIAGVQTGDIVGWVQQKDIPLTENGAVISGNHCLSVGLRIGIEVLTQGGNTTATTITNNIIKGPHQGIKVYKGSYQDFSNAITHIREVIISNNHISYCREAGIYVRANHGVLINSNYISNCALHDTGDGTAYAGILVRVGADKINSHLSLEVGNLVTNNFIVDVGKSTGAVVVGKGIMVRTENTTVSGNKIVQSRSDLIGTGHGVLVGYGDSVKTCVVSDNTISGFALGVYYSASTWTTDNLTCKGNRISKCSSYGISLEPSSFNNRILENVVTHCRHGLRIKNAQSTIVRGNILEDLSEVAIMLGSGTFAGEAYGGGVRTQATTQILYNIINRCLVPHQITETAPLDTSFKNRCKVWHQDLVDGEFRPVV